MEKISYGGFIIWKEFLARDSQEELVESVRGILRAAPLFQPMTPWGKPMSVRMTSAGKYGWFTDRSGYRYVPRHPSGVAWPPIPASILRVWDELVGAQRQPDCCLVNFYDQAARMGLHRDADEADFSWPVLSISLGDTGRFRMGGLARQDPTRAIPLESGDVVVIGGAARLAYHGVDRINPGSSTLFPQGGRINLTLRVVDP